MHIIQTVLYRKLLLYWLLAENYYYLHCGWHPRYKLYLEFSLCTDSNMGQEVMWKVTCTNEFSILGAMWISILERFKLYFSWRVFEINLYCYFLLLFVAFQPVQIMRRMWCIVLINCYRVLYLPLYFLYF